MSKQAFELKNLFSILKEINETWHQNNKKESTRLVVVCRSDSGEKLYRDFRG